MHKRACFGSRFSFRPSGFSFPASGLSSLAFPFSFPKPEIKIPVFPSRFPVSELWFPALPFPSLASQTKFRSLPFSFLLYRTKKGSYLFRFHAYLMELGSYLIWFALYRTELGSPQLLSDAYLFSSALYGKSSDKDGFWFAKHQLGCESDSELTLPLFCPSKSGDISVGISQPTPVLLEKSHVEKLLMGRVSGLCAPSGLISAAHADEHRDYRDRDDYRFNYGGYSLRYSAPTPRYYVPPRHDYRDEGGRYYDRNGRVIEGAVIGGVLAR